MTLITISECAPYSSFSTINWNRGQGYDVFETSFDEIDKTLGEEDTGNWILTINHQCEYSGGQETVC